MSDTGDGNGNKRSADGRNGIILPYIDMGGVWSVPDASLEALWEQMGDEKTLSAVFSLNEVTEPESFIKYLKNPGNLPVFVVRDDRIAILAWLNGAQE